MACALIFLVDTTEKHIDRPPEYCFPELHIVEAPATNSVPVPGGVGWNYDLDGHACPPIYNDTTNTVYLRIDWR